MFIQQKLNAV